MSSTVKVEAQGRYLSLKIETSIVEERRIGRRWYPIALKRKHAGVTGALRSTIKEYSRSSRKRQMETFARLIIPEKNVFVTLTYGQKFPPPIFAKKHLDTLGKRLMRAYPHAAIGWRMEMQRRGAPHFHLMILGVNFVPIKKLRRTWLQIIGDEYADMSNGKPRCPQINIQQIASVRAIVNYVAKYMAKASNKFNTHAYLTGLHPEHENPGRWWGWIGRENLRFDLLMTLRVPYNSRALWQFRFEMGKIWIPVRFMDKGKGFSLFHDSVYNLLMLYQDYNRRIKP